MTSILMSSMGFAIMFMDRSPPFAFSGFCPSVALHLNPKILLPCLQQFIAF